MSNKRIIISNEIINNKKIPNEAFYLYVMMKSMAVNNLLTIYHKKLMKNIEWSQYQLRKYTTILKKVGLINYDFEQFPKFRPMEINIVNKRINDNNSTGLSIDTINQIIENSKEITCYYNGEERIVNLREVSLRIFYIYVSLYDEDKGYTSITHSVIRDIATINSMTIKAVNENLVKHNLLEYEAGKFELIDFGEEIGSTRIKQSNKYKPLFKEIIYTPIEEDIDTLKSMPYSKYLLTKHWLKTKGEALKRAKYKCQICSSKEELNVHHNTYENRGHEEDSDLVVLCHDCHARFHDKLKDDNIEEEK